MDEEQTYRLELQYDGTDLHGWAKQEGCATVEGRLEQALTTVLGKSPALRVAGRTDAGVHARRQVVSLRLPAGLDAAKLAHSLNALTPPGISVTDLWPAPPGFDARKDALSRTYRYFLQSRRGGLALLRPILVAGGTRRRHRGLDGDLPSLCGVGTISPPSPPRKRSMASSIAMCCAADGCGAAPSVTR